MKANTTQRFILSIFAACTSLAANAQSPTYQWLNQGYPATGIFPPQVMENSIAVDAAGNSYVTGTFHGRTMFGKGADTIPVIEHSAGSADNSDTYLAKYDNAGTIVWVRQGEVKQHYAGYNYGSGVAVDAAGNVYISGFFHDSVIVGSTVLTTVTTNHSGAFIAKYDASGNLMWAKKAGTGDMYVAGIALDGSGNCYLSGSMSYSGTIGSSTFSNGFFVAKYSTDGDPVWAVGNQNNCYGLAVAASDNGVLATGYFYGSTPTFGATTLNDPVPANQQFFVVKLDTAGNYQWAVGNASTDAHTTSMGEGIALDNSGNAFVTGYYASELKLGSDVLSGNTTQKNIFLVKFNAAGTEQWERGFTATNGNDNGTYGICADNSGNSYITGYNDYSTNFGAATLGTPVGGFVAKFDASGTNLWAIHAGSKYGKAIATNASGALTLTGDFQYTETFGTLTINNPSFYPSMFVARLNDVTGINEAVAAVSTLNAYPDPATDHVFLSFEKQLDNAQLVVTDLTGRIVISTQLKNTDHAELTTAAWNAGIYYVRVTAGTASQTKKIIIIK